MIKKQQKWTALLMTISFAWLLRVSAMPVAAAGTTEAVTSASVEQAPRVFEQQGPEWNRPVKKKTVLIIVGVLCALAIIISVSVGSAMKPRGNRPAARQHSMLESASN